jgi:hypothetical protein
MNWDPHLKRAVLIAAYLNEFAQIFDMYGKTLTPKNFEIFEDAFKTVDPAVLEYAFQEWRRKGKKFPAPGDIDEILNEVRESAADAAFTHLQKILHAHWYGELLPVFTSSKTTAEAWKGRVEEYGGGFLLHPPALDAASAHAVRQAGGFERLSRIRGRELEIARKEFVKDHSRFSGRPIEIGPSNEEAKKLLERLGGKDACEPSD